LEQKYQLRAIAAKSKITTTIAMPAIAPPASACFEAGGDEVLDADAEFTLDEVLGVDAEFTLDDVVGVPMLDEDVVGARAAVVKFR
jgi:hypothetical protein